MALNFLYILIAPIILSVLINAFANESDNYSILRSVITLFAILFVLFILTSISEYLYIFAFITLLVFSLLRVALGYQKYLRILNSTSSYFAVVYAYLGVVFFLYGQEGLELGHTIAMSLWPSIDNNIYLIISKNFNSLGSEIWTHPIWDKVPLTDRLNPVMGLILGIYWFFPVENLIYCVGVACQCLWVLPCSYILAGSKNRLLRVFFVASLPVVFFYSIYLWWKILAATFLLIAIYIYLNQKKGAYFSILMAIFTHASHVYSTAYFFIRRGGFYKSEFFMVALFVALFIAVNLMWPSSGQLVRWHLFGEPDFIDSLKNLFNTKILSIHYLEFKGDNFINFIYPKSVIESVMSSRPFHSGLFLRYLQQYSLVASLIVFIPFMDFKSAYLPKQYYIFLLITLIATNLGEYGGPQSEAILHHRSFAEFMVLSLVSVSHIRFRIFVIVSMIINIINFIYIWKPRVNVDGIYLTENISYLSYSMILIVFLFFILSEKKLVFGNEKNAK